ncbi:MAG TPA: class I SAM-dependent methyltransferase, partial [Dehalococcoidia bacterium]|nr:class I SAM-dependent methyltransferase [Dehalococcoidia bacterium]
EDASVEALAGLIDRAGRVIDVGAGGGRIAIPLARHCREVVAVEPSPAMRSVLDEAIQRHGATNVRILPATWEEATVEPADLAFASHVTYGVCAIEPFLRKLDAHATRHAALVIMTDPPQASFAPFWRAVYGEDRLRLPCRDEVLAVLRELGADPEILPLPPVPPGPFGPRDEAIDILRLRLFTAPGTPADDRLLASLDDLTEERDGHLWARDARPRERQIIRWTPGIRG